MASGEGQLEIVDLHVYHGRAHVLQGVQLIVAAEPVALLGRNGMGKTTLCQAIMGLIPVASGDIRFDGVSLIGRKPHEIASLGIGYVPQGRRIFPSLSVDEHLRLMQNAGSGRAGGWTPARIYETFPRLAERKANGAAALSGGEQQMLAIGRALLLNPRLLIMDEPSEGLAPVIVQQVLDTLHRLSGEGITLLIVEQKLAVAAAAADRLAIMLNGRIALETTAPALLADETAQRRYLGVGIALSGTA
jgi:branched-chain amino acid transport system ATP-binding protein